MFKWLTKLAGNDAVVKGIFEHLTNFGICGVLLAAANWQFRHIGEGFHPAIDYVAGGGLLLTALFTLWINFENGFLKLKTHDDRMNLQQAGLVLVYLTFMSPLLGAAVQH